MPTAIFPNRQMHIAASCHRCGIPYGGIRPTQPAMGRDQLEQAALAQKGPAVIAGPLKPYVGTGSGGGHQSLGLGDLAHLLLQLLKSAHLDLTDAFAADAVLL